MSDDWMNPPSNAGAVYIPQPVKDEDQYVIERARKIICFGNPGYIIEWIQWGMPYKTAAERDTAMEDLSKEHPMWHLRPRTRNRWREQFYSGAVSHAGINK